VFFGERSKAKGKGVAVQTFHLYPFAFNLLKGAYPEHGRVFKTQFLFGVNIFKSALGHQRCFVKAAKD
jgi:hypothetical protein